MIDPDLQAVVDAMSVRARLELVEYIESTVERSQVAVTEEQRLLIRSRVGDLQVDPLIGLTWEELDARMGDWK